MYANILLAHRTFLMEQAEVCYLISSISPLRENVVSKGGLCFVKLYQVDNLMRVLCFPTAGGKSVKKPRFSLRGYDFVPLDVKTDNLCIGEQDVSSAVPSTKASQTMVAERLENVEEQTEDLAPEFALPPKANTSVSELLDNLQRRGGSFVRTPSLLHQHAPSISIREQEVSSGVPPTKASQALMDEPFENVNGQTEELPSELPCSIKRPKFSVAELLEDLQVTPTHQS